MRRPRVIPAEMQKEDLPFLLDLWHIPEVMHYADEFPWLRGWSRADDPSHAWDKHQEHRDRLGSEFIQLILWLGDLRIGESFTSPLSEEFTFGRWQKPPGVCTLMGDIKLRPEYWGQGFGTEGMRQVAKWVFSRSGCDLFVVPPHRRNPAAEKVYTKAGFVRYRGMRSWRNHRIMELTRERFVEMHGNWS